MLRATALGAGLLLLALFSSTPARADDPLNSNDKPVNADVPVTGLPPAKDFEHNEYNIVPIVGGSTDIGIGGGYFANFAHLKTGFDPFVWDIESAGLITFKGDGGLQVPYTDIYMKLAIPRLFGHPIRLEIRPSYTAETTIHYYGLGNASPANGPPGTSDSYLEYGRSHPQLDLDLRIKFADHYSGRFGARYIQNWFQINPNSSLANDMANGSPEVKSVLGQAVSHGMILLKTGLQYDTRDNEASTYEGMLDTLDVRVSPGGGGEFPYRYGEATLNLRMFVPIRSPYITLAARLVTNLLFGEVPFYELSRFDDTYALGGTNGVRGIPAGRYSGKIKIFGNLELRNELVAFHWLGKPLVFGITAFFDGGRLWADYGSNPQLDGTGLGLHYGTGAGLRLQSGSAFVLRADIAWSPDATPIGGYFSAGQMF